MPEEQLTQAHAVLDAKRLAMVDRTVVHLLHDAVYPSNTVESPATTKLRSILKTPEQRSCAVGSAGLTTTEVGPPERTRQTIRERLNDVWVRGRSASNRLY